MFSTDIEILQSICSITNSKSGTIAFPSSSEQVPKHHYIVHPGGGGVALAQAAGYSMWTNVNGLIWFLHGKLKAIIKVGLTQLHSPLDTYNIRTIIVKKPNLFHST